MICRLDLSKFDDAQSLLEVQRLAYRVEADLIGFYDIPPLKDTIHSLQRCNETFYGCIRETEMIGAISYTRDVDVVEIFRLIVHPKCFRQGIGRTLVEKVLSVENHASRYIVSTGKKNLPAVNLYQHFGFVEIGTTEVSPDIFLAHFEKTNAE